MFIPEKTAENCNGYKYKGAPIRGHPKLSPCSRFAAVTDTLIHVSTHLSAVPKGATCDSLALDGELSFWYQILTTSSNEKRYECGPRLTYGKT